MVAARGSGGRPGSLRGVVRRKRRAPFIPVGIWKPAALLIAVALLALVTPCQAMPLSGSWTSTLTLTFTPTFTMAMKSVASITGALSGVAYRTTTVLTQDGIYSYTVGASWSAWVLDFDTSLAFLGSVPRMDYFMFETSTMLAGLSLESTLLLEYEATSKAYGFGWEWVMEGKLTQDVSLKITNQLGLEENLAEQLGWQFGSGYDIVPRTDPASLCYGTTWIEITGVTFCDSEAELTTKITGKNGFEYLWISYDFQLDPWPLGFEVDLQFQLQTKSLRLRPYIETEAGCIEVYVRVSPWQLEPGAGEMTGLVVQGFRFTCEELAPFTFSAVAALDDNLYRRRGPATDIELRAWDYVVRPAPIDLLYYVMTPYRQVWTLQKTDEHYMFAVDLYFRSGAGLFNLALVTAETRFSLCDYMNLRAGLAVGTSSGPTMVFEFSLPF